MGPIRSYFSVSANFLDHINSISSEIYRLSWSYSINFKFLKEWDVGFFPWNKRFCSLNLSPIEEKSIEHSCPPDVRWTIRQLLWNTNEETSATMVWFAKEFSTAMQKRFEGECRKVFFYNYDKQTENLALYFQPSRFLNNWILAHTIIVFVFF